MKGDEVLENADVVITDNRIIIVGKQVKQISSKRESNRCVRKNNHSWFIDTHAHLHYSGFEIFPDQKWEYIANLAYGVTTVYDPSAPNLRCFFTSRNGRSRLDAGTTRVFIREWFYMADNLSTFLRK